MKSADLLSVSCHQSNCLQKREPAAPRGVIIEKNRQYSLDYQENPLA
jgi:hypothetical protein